MLVEFADAVSDLSCTPKNRYVWRAINDSQFAPRVVIIEYNAGIPTNVSAVVDIADAARWTGTNYFGASLRALAELGASKGYSLIYCDRRGVNAFFVRSDILRCQGVVPPSVEAVWRPPAYGLNSRGHPPELNTSRQYVILDAAGHEVKREHVAQWPQQ